MLRLFVTGIMLELILTGYVGAAGPMEGEYFAGQDLHLVGDSITVCQPEEKDQADHVIVFEGGFSLSIGANRLSSDSAVIWLWTSRADYLGRQDIDYNAQVYLAGNVRMERGKGAKATDLGEMVLEKGQALVGRFLVTGEVFATAPKQQKASVSDLGQMQLYQDAVTAVKPVVAEPRIAKGAVVPPLKIPEAKIPAPAEPVVKPQQEPQVGDEPQKPSEKTPAVPAEKLPAPEPQYRYPINLAGIGGQGPVIESSKISDGTEITTVTGRFYLWQKLDEKGSLLEFQADSAVIFHGGGSLEVSKQVSADNILAGGSVRAVYLRGNIVMTEGPRTIRADEIYYDFDARSALALKAEMRNFDVKRNLPIYLRADELRQVSDKMFEADNIVLTTSEFYVPQISMTASRLVLTDTTAVEQRRGNEPDKSSYDGTLYDVRMKLGKTSIFAWPKVRTDFVRPDVPIRQLRIGNDSDLGTSLETQWYLDRLLGFPSWAGVDSSLNLDYFSKRGPGAGVDMKYKKEDYYGRLTSYILKDRGTDDLGRSADRKNLDPGEDIRGQFRLQHRHFLPDDWQLILEASYISDRNFLEWFRRSEFDVDKEQETLVYLKRIRDNWGFSFLNKFRINDFQTMTEELPTAEFHLAGQSFWDDMLTFYSDSRLSRLRERQDSASTSGNIREKFYSFASTRNEVDMPLMLSTIRVVPFVAGTYAFDDGDGFYADLDGTTIARGREETAVIGEMGIRLATMFWREDPLAQSSFWDINGIRHIVKPHVEAVSYHSNEDVTDMRDVVNFGLSQRWQSKRGPAENQRTFDWMRLDVDATWVGNPEDSDIGPAESYGPAAFMWNNPSIPVFYRRGSGTYGVVRDSINMDYLWRLSETTTLLSDMNYDIDSGVVQQLDIGMSRYIYPDISYYLGSRYLRPVLVESTAPSDSFHEKGSHSVIAAITYALNDRYTLMFSQEYNFDYGRNVGSELAIIRRYHRLYYGLTFSIDQSLARQSVMFSIWPEGIKELSFGSRRYVGIMTAMEEN